MKLWVRYLFKQLAKVFLFLLVSLFALYVIVDLSVNSVRFFSSGGTTFAEMALYYLRNFAKHLELFLPLSFLLSSIKVLYDLNSHRELVALQMAGLSKKKLLLPFFLFAALLSSACYINSQWLAPDAQDAANAFRQAHAKNKKKKREHLFSLSLKDDSELIYQSFDRSHQELFDVFWVRSAQDIWHMKFLKVDSHPPVGCFVDHLLRNQENLFEKKESFERLTLTELPWADDLSLQRYIPFENRPLSLLFRQACSNGSEKRSILSHLHFKLALPLLPFLVLFSMTPYLLRFSRTFPIFLFSASCLFAFIGLNTILEGLLILAENQVLSPFFAIWTPILFSFILSLRAFLKI